MIDDKSIMRLAPLWVILLVFVAATIEGVYPGVKILEIMSEPWIETLLVAVGLGGIPLSMFKRIVGDAKVTKPT